MPRSILAEARRIVEDHDDDYGTVEETHVRIAAGWSVIFGTRVTPKQVALAMAWLKICRSLAAGDRDSLVDLAGYASIAATLEGHQ